MRILFYSIKDFEKAYLGTANNNRYKVDATSDALTLRTVKKSKGYEIVCVFAGDDVSAPVVEELFKNGVRLIAIRAAGYDNVAIKKAYELGIKVVNVPAYSPYAIAEHAAALILALNRKIALAKQQVSKYDFTVNNLVGFDLHGKTVGIIGTGKIGSVFAGIMHGFGCKLIGHDMQPDYELTIRYSLRYLDLAELCRQSDIISIHTSLTPQTKYLINADLVKQMKKGVMLINTSRGACVQTADIIHYLKNGHIGYYGADVYERERGIFFYDHSAIPPDEAMLDELLSLPNVIITPHQAFATNEALTNIAQTTFYNIDSWVQHHDLENEVQREEMTHKEKLFNTYKTSV